MSPVLFISWRGSVTHTFTCLNCSLSLNFFFLVVVFVGAFFQAYTTCHHPLLEPPSRSECEAGGLQGPPGPSGMSDCCCSCRGNRERWYDHTWHFLSSPHRMLRETKDRERKERKMTNSWRMYEKSMGNNYGRRFLEKMPSLSTDCISIQWTVAGLHWTAHLGLRVCDCVWWTCKENSKNSGSNTISSEQLQASTEKAGAGRWAFTSRRTILMWPTSN